MEVPENITKPALHVLHAELERANEESAYKSVCPACKSGLLLMRREPGAYHLLRADRCSGCGQAVVYRDRTINGELLHPLQGGEA
jgi:hypothetical protein